VRLIAHGRRARSRPHRRTAGSPWARSGIDRERRALQGAPVTTIDLDFLYCRTPANWKKLKALAADLEAVILKPQYPVSGLLRVARDSDGLQLDFMTAIDGVRSFEGLRKRARVVRFGETTLYVASLADIQPRIMKAA
jgi:hypothetical protein